MKNFYSRLMGGVALVLAFSASLRAEVQVVDDYDGQNGFRLFKMTVTPAAEPKPALKHRMWLKPHQLKPGNAAMRYVRIFAENWYDSAWKSVTDRYGEIASSWYRHEVAIEDLPLEDVRWTAAQFDSLIVQSIQPGTRCRDSDWGLELMDLRGPESVTFRLPDFQQIRGVSRMLGICTRLAIAEGRYDDAIEHIRMNYRVGHDVGKEMFVVCNLIGIAMEGVAEVGVIDLIAAPDSPNLYWALSEIPTPLVDCREAIRLEMSLGTRIFPALMDAETTEHSPQEWARLFREGIETFRSIGITEGFKGFESNSQLLEGVAGLGLSLAEYPAAKKRLIESGMEVSRVEKMPVGKVMLVDAAREYRRIADEVEKWWYVSYVDFRVRKHELESVWQEDHSPMNVGRTIAQLLLPAVQAARMAQSRSAWRKQALLVIEALRMHASETGSFPESLDQIQVVPVPLNPITTEPYVYHLDGEMAVLELPFSDGMPGLAYRYEITLAGP